ncbi:MAG: sigma-54-dependent Fis family transcriptional regulator [Bdellovibrionaceae bacterium]|nr:sigma-54-dependent Fis family transcriptional regulator [Pseudobdellovibrionaceae bacterium]
MNTVDLFGMNYKSEIYQSLQKLVQSILPLESNINVNGSQGTGKSTWSQFILDQSGLSEHYGKIDIKEMDEDKFKVQLEACRYRHILIENIDYLHKDNQAILAQYIQTRSLQQKPVIITTSKRSLSDLAREGLLRQDLYYKLSVFNINLPDLKQAKAEIKTFAEYYLKAFATNYKRPLMSLSNDAMVKLESFFWVGNILELENVVERAVLLCEGEVINDKHIRFDEFQKYNSLDLSLGMSLSEVERRLILQTLEHTQNNRTKAAHILGISIRTLRNKINEYKEAGLI